MHPILARGRHLGLHLVLFLQAGLLLAEVLVRGGGAPRALATALAVPLLVFHAFTCLASWYLTRSLPLGETRAERLLVTLGVAALIGGGSLLAAGALWSRLLDLWTPLAGARSLFRDSAALIFVVGLLLFSLSLAVHYLLGALERSRVAEARAYELRILAREAELRALKAQVDPHFLFNSLNSINALVGSDPAAARRMCTLLSGFLRRSLRLGGAPSIPLVEELELATTYLEIERVRFGERLRVESHIEEGSGELPVPPLLLQPLVENAVRHGIGQRLEGGTVSLRAERRGARLRLVVENPCDADRPRRGAGGKGAGIGLENVRRRLTAAFHDEATVRIEDRDERFRVEISLPITAEGATAAVEGAA